MRKKWRITGWGRGEGDGEMGKAEKRETPSVFRLGELKPNFRLAEGFVLFLTRFTCCKARDGGLRRYRALALLQDASGGLVGYSLLGAWVVVKP